MSPASEKPRLAVVISASPIRTVGLGPSRIVASPAGIAPRSVPAAYVEMKTPASAFDSSYLSAKCGTKGVSAVKNNVSTATTTLTRTSRRRMAPKLSAPCSATVPRDEHRDDAYEPRRDRTRALRRGRPEDGRELPEARRRRLLQRRQLPPRDQGLHDPGRRSDRHGERRARLHVRGRVQRAQDRARRAGDGERGSEYERQPVLHRHDGRRSVAGRQAHRVRTSHRRYGSGRLDRG